MNIWGKIVFVSGVFLASGIRAGTIQEVIVPEGHIALHNNQIFIKRGGGWISVGGVSPNGGRFYVSKLY